MKSVATDIKTVADLIAVLRHCDFNARVSVEQDESPQAYGEIHEILTDDKTVVLMFKQPE